MKRPIAPSLSPNTERDDILLAIKMLFSPIQWFNFRYTEKLENKFSDYFGSKYKAIAVNSGRSALYLILKSLEYKPGDGVGLQALTCSAVPNPILWNKLTPVYLDIDKNYNVDAISLKRNLGKNIKALIVQHSFGIPSNLDEIKRVTKKHNLVLIEDCALSLGAEYKKRKLGTFGDIAFFSFGRDKVISSVFGGMIMVSNAKLYDKLLIERDKLSYPSFTWVIKQLMHPVIFSVVLPFYNFGLGKFTLGKIMIFFLMKLGFIDKPVSKEEEFTKKPDIFPKKMPGALSYLALNQFEKLERLNKHRVKIANIYFKRLKKSSFVLPNKVNGSIWVRFPLLCDNKEDVLKFFKKNKILLGNWYSKVVFPSFDLNLFGYRRGSCLKAEKITRQIINLPTYISITIDDANKICDLLLECKKNIK